jgi:hypothetical protein
VRRSQSLPTTTKPAARSSWAGAADVALLIDVPSGAGSPAPRRVAAPAWPQAVVRAVATMVTVVVAGGAFAPGAGAANGPRFSAPAFTPTRYPNRVVTGDFNGDAAPDIAATDVCNGISVLLGNGDGNFSSPIRSCGVDSGGEVEGVAVADVSGDGRQDIVFVRFGERGPISIWINDGGGRFHRAGVFRSGTWAFGLVAADLNADGIVDLATENQARRELVVLLGTGGGHFAAARRFTGDAALDPADAGFGAVAVGEVNGDGKPDAVLTSFDTRLAVVRIGNGDGSFGPERTLGHAPFGDGVTLADLNHDGRLDVVAALAESKTVVFLGNGDGTFGAIARYTMDPGNFLQGVAVADFDSDANPDIAAISLGDTAEDGLFVRVGRGDGLLGGLRGIRSGPYAVSDPVVADFNRDGRPDVTYAANPDHSRGGVGVSLNSTGLPAPPCVPGFLFRRPLRTAKREIRRGGCRVGHVRYRYSRKVGKNRVIAQRPRSGTVLPNRARVILVASRGPRH